jgi:hypothetical protein
MTFILEGGYAAVVDIYSGTGPNITTIKWKDMHIEI